MIDCVVVATRNKKKRQEILELLAPRGIQVKSIDEFPDCPEVIEDGTTFAENAAKKASQTALATGNWAIGEDSGLAVDALDGAPGVYSARFSDPGATDQRNNEKLVELLKHVPEEKRGAGYVCHVALSDPQGKVVWSSERSCRGKIVLDPRGTNGFGYDPHFLVLEYHKTFGELPPAVKRALSHRARAFSSFPIL